MREPPRATLRPSTTASLATRSIAAQGVMLYAFTVPFQRAFALPPLGSPAALAGALALVAGVAALAAGGHRHQVPTAVLAGAGLASFVVLSLAWGQLPTNALEPGLRSLGPMDAERVLQLVVTLWLMWEFIDRDYLRDRLFASYVLGCHVAAAFTLNEWRSLGGANQVRISGGESVLPNPQAFTLAIGVPLAWFVFLRSRNPLTRVAMLAYIPIGSVAVLLTGSRTGALALGLGLLMIPLTLNQLPPAWRSITIVALVLTLPAIPATIPEDTLGRALATGETSDLGTAAEKRDSLRSLGGEVFLTHPIIGSGTGSVRQVYAERNPGYDTRVSSHNSPLNVAAEHGIFAFALFVLMMGCAGVAIRRGRKLDRSMATLVFLMLVIVQQFVNLDLHKTTWLVVGFLLVHGRVAGSLESEATEAAP